MIKKGQLESVAAAMTAIYSDKTSARLEASRALRRLSEHSPELVYPHFEFFVELLGHRNSIIRWNAIFTLGNLAPVEDGKLDRILDTYLAPIRGPHLIDAANTIKAAGAIARTKPHLADRIAAGILQVEDATYATPECLNVAIGCALESLEPLVSRTGSLADSTRTAIEQFVGRQLLNPRNATRQKAARLRKRLSGSFRVRAPRNARAAGTSGSAH
jgi:hypothetical protein